MRKYLFHYWIEKNDESVDCEKFIEADDIESALVSFKENTRVYRRITKIEEV